MLIEPIVSSRNLDDSDVHKSIFKMLQAQEDIAIEKGWINATGVIAVAEKI